MLKWNGWGKGNSLTAEQMNEAVPFGQVFIGAGSFSPAELEPAIFIPAVQMGAGDNDTEDAWLFSFAAKAEIYANWSFADLPIDLANPSFKIFPHFKQTAVVAKPSPAEFVEFEYGIGVNADGNDSVYTMTDLPATSEVQAEFVSFAVGTGGSQVSKAITTINGDGLPLSSTNKTNVRFAVARIPLDANDDFNEDLLFIGMGVQYKTDFNNVKEWPT